LTNSPISKLVELAQTGNKAAFEQLYNETIHQVYRTLYMLCGSRSDAEDIAQTVYLELYTSLPKYDRSRSFHGWLYGIAIRQFQAYKRQRWREYRKLRKEQELMAAMPVMMEDASTGLGLQFDVMEQLHKLPDPLKQVLVLRYVNDLPQQEIADILAIPVGTVKSRLNQALVRMRHTLRREPNVQR